MNENYNNELIISPSGVRLMLASEPDNLIGRKLGKLGGDSLYLYRDEVRHLHRKSNSYGFNLKLLQLPRIKKIILNEGNINKYVIPKEIILREGKILFFKQQGFEKQIFLSKNLIEKYKK